MTLYVSDFPYAPDAYHLWADDPDEAFIAACAVGAEPMPARSPLHYAVNWRQVLEARQLGAVTTDRGAPMEAAARWAGNTTALQSIAAWRRAGFPGLTGAQAGASLGV